MDNQTIICRSLLIAHCQLPIVMKHDWKPGTMIYPLPAVMVSCGSEPSEYNIITGRVGGYDMY